MNKYIDKLNELLEKNIDADKASAIKWAISNLENSQGSAAKGSNIDALKAIAEDENYKEYAQALNWAIYSLENFFI